MEETLRFSIVIYLNKINSVFFRDSLESIAASVYRNFELIIVDGTGLESNGSVAGEFFPEEGRLRFYKIRRGRCFGYGINLATTYARGDVILFMDGHSRMSSHALTELAKEFTESESDLVYTDHDELEGNDRVNPYFKSGANLELLRHKNYIGNIFAITSKTMRRLGSLRDALESAVMYDLLLRCFEEKLKIAHIPRLLFSKRLYEEDLDKQNKNQKLFREAREHVTVVAAHFRRLGIEADISPVRRGAFWQIDYDGSGYKSHRKDYILVREGGVKVSSFREALYRMYGHMKQPDVGVVGVAFQKGFFTFENCGYIFDTSGRCYPACHGQNTFLDGYDYRCIIPQDVSAVDFGFCMIKKKLFNHLKGFDTALKDRDMMLDFCLRARKQGYRIVFEPAVRAGRRKSSHESSAESNDLLMEKHREVIELGDPFYNKNLPMGLENYYLY